MEHHVGSSARVRRSEPSWPAVIAATARLWLERHRMAGPGTSGARRALALAVVLVATAAGVIIGHAATSPRAVPQRAASSQRAVPQRAVPQRAVPQRAASPHQTGSAALAALGAAAATRDQAATWIAAQIAPGAIVACDPAMCTALQASGLAGGRLLALGTSAADPLGSDVVVATPALRGQLGPRLASVYAPEVLASFGAGASRIEVRAVAPDGAAAYRSALAADQRARIAAGAQLLRNPRISVAAGARSALSAGEVDPRLLITLAALAAAQPVRILAFADPSPDASLPLRGAEIAPLRPGTRASARLRSMMSFLGAQRAPFLPLRTALAGASALSLEYAAPGPLGLLSGP